MSYHLLEQVSITKKFSYDKFFDASEFISYELQFTRYLKEDFKKSLILDSIDNMLELTDDIINEYNEFLESSIYSSEMKYYNSELNKFKDLIKSLTDSQNNIL
jgi:hypothetical protein